jgi:hypothetical protein
VYAQGPALSIDSVVAASGRATGVVRAYASTAAVAPFAHGALPMGADALPNPPVSAPRALQASDLVDDETAMSGGGTVRSIAPASMLNASVESHVSQSWLYVCACDLVNVYCVSAACGQCWHLRVSVVSALALIMACL